MQSSSDTLTTGKAPTKHELEIKRQQEQKAREANEEKAKETKAVDEANIPKRYAAASMEGIERNMPAADDWVTRCWVPAHSYVHKLDEHIQAGHGLLMYGARGRMKTTLAVAILKENLKRGRGGYFIPMCSLVDMLRTKWQMDQHEAAAFDQRLRNTSLLVLDDMGAENTEKDWVLNKIESIVTDRYNNLKSTIITTNLSKQELTKTYTGRLIDRLKESTLSIEFSGESFRKSLLSQMRE